MRDKIMRLVSEICDMKSTNCKSLNKAVIARKLLDMANVPKNANIQEIPLDWNNQVVILFLVPGDDNYYSLFTGIGNDGNFYFELTITGILNGDMFEFFGEEKPLNIDYFRGSEMKKYNIWKTNGKSDELCCQIEAQNQKSALRKYRKSLLSSGQYWIENNCLRSSYGGEWKAIETV